LTAAGFTVTVTARQDAGAAANIVVEQSPRSTALPGSAISLFVSAGG
jgi:beta-lactam-binding protein with PASTA domain